MSMSLWWSTPFSQVKPKIVFALMLIALGLESPNACVPRAMNAVYGRRCGQIARLLPGSNSRNAVFAT